MKGSAVVSTATETVTLGPEELQELNDRIADSRPDLIPFNLLKLRRIFWSRERQRIKNIRVTRVQCEKLKSKLPDMINFKFVLDGKSIVRARHRLFAFDPEVPISSDGVATPGVTFETNGGIRTFDSTGGRSKTVGWTKARGTPLDVLEGDALWQKKDDSQENLLTNLMRGYGDQRADRLITISQFRPGVFSDFLMMVEFSPPGDRVKFTELTLQLAEETGDNNVRSVSVSVDNNRDLEIPITVSKKDQSGRDGGIGRYVGCYPNLTNLAEDPIRFSVPATYGRYRHAGWLVDGHPVENKAYTINVSESSYLTALYQE
jgi:hypothetical protein